MLLSRPTRRIGPPDELSYVIGMRSVSRLTWRAGLLSEVATCHTRYVTSTIRTTCVACGTVDIPVAAAQLVLDPHADDPRNRLEFHCPSCRAPRSELVGERATRLLSNAGITIAAPAAPPASAHDGTAGTSYERPAR